MKHGRLALALSVTSLLIIGSCKPPAAASSSVALGNAPSKGPLTAKVTVVEFGDFECPFCGQEEPVIAQILVHYGDQLHFVFKQFPLTSIHPNAQRAAEAALAANAQGQFWPYHDLLYAHQTALSDAALLSYAQELGLDRAAFSAAMSAHAEADAVAADIAEGEGLGVTGTPTFFINGVMMVGAVDYATFAAAVDRGLADAK